MEESAVGIFSLYGSLVDTCVDGTLLVTLVVDTPAATRKPVHGGKGTLQNTGVI